MDEQPFTPERGNAGVRGGALWNPAEVDVSIRPGWFWHPDENDQVRSPANLMKLYFESAGRGANLLLNVPPDRRGRIHEADAQALRTFRAALDEMMSRDLASGAKVSASSEFSPAFAAAHVLSTTQPWAARADDTAGAWIALELPKAETFNVVRLREAIEYGVRIDEFALDVWHDDAWQTCAVPTCVGPRRLIRLDGPVTAAKVRLRILKAAASPILSQFSLYLLPDLIEEPAVDRDAQGMVTLRPNTAGTVVFYTLDGSQPGVRSQRYEAPFALLTGGTVRAIAVRIGSAARSQVVSQDFDIAPRDWRVISATGDVPGNLLTGETFLGAPNRPVDIVIDLAQEYPLTGFTLKPVFDHTLSTALAAQVGPPARFTAWVSKHGRNWGMPASQGEFANIAASRVAQEIHFDAPHSGRYLRLHLPEAVRGKIVIGIGGIGVVTNSAAVGKPQAGTT
jgi:alpha-L-fucosidase